MKREEQINKALEDLLDDAGISMEDRPLLRMWCKLGVNLADKNPIDRTLAASPNPSSYCGYAVDTD